MNLVIFLTLFTLASSQTQDQSLYVRLGSVFESICLGQTERTDLPSRQSIPGKMGAKGEPGIKGSKGEPGEPDYDRVEEMISKALDIQARKLANLSDMLSEAKQEIRQLKNATISIGQRVDDVSEYCPVKYDGKCFWIEYREHPTINFQKGTEICAGQGGKPANIYSEDHFYIMMGYLGMFTWKRGYVHAWIGMTYNAQTKTTSFSDGSPAAFTRWHPGHPSDCCNMGLKVFAEWQNKDQYLFAHKGSYAFQGVICER